MATQILLVEDDNDLAQSLTEYLQQEGFAVTTAATAKAAQEIGIEAADLVILDWMLPDGAGIDLIRQWRAQGLQTPILLLTARADLVDRVVGLELGANDYMTKPFEPRELLARLRVQMRMQQQTVPDNKVLRCAEIELNTVTREVRFKNHALELSRQEFSLLKLFLENPNRVFSREEILHQAWGYDSFPTTRTIDTHVLQLRQKTSAQLFETVRGIGYRLRCPTEEKN